MSKITESDVASVPTQNKNTPLATPLIQQDYQIDAAGGPVLQKDVTKVRKLSEVTALIVAERIVDFCNDHGDLISNLKLQKLVYYVQAWYLALYEKPLFNEPIIATHSGPVQKDVFERYQNYGSGPIDQDNSGREVPEKLDDHIRDVMEAYGHLSAYDLELATCEEEPCRAARRQGNEVALISPEVMKKFYQIRLHEQKQEQG